MASRGVVSIFILSALPILCLEFRRGIPDLGLKDLFLLCGRIFLALALLTLIISVTTSWLNSFKSSQVYLKEGEEENEKRQRLVRKKQQEAQGEKASRYMENVLKPQQEMKLKKLEERFYQMTGETWKLSSGHKLGGDEDLVPEDANPMSSETSSRNAARRCKPSREALPPAVQPVQKEKEENVNKRTRAIKVNGCYPVPRSTNEEKYCIPIKVVDLPEEPSPTAREVVTVALRCPTGSVLRRRFLKSCRAQVLLDWMMNVGYHTALYSLSTSFPRKPLEVAGGWSLEDVGITVDTVLNVEEKEQSAEA